MIKLITTESNEEFYRTLEKVIQEIIADFSQKLITVGLSGGSMVSILSLVLPKLDTDLKKWRFFFCDERLVPFNDGQSTFGSYLRQFTQSKLSISSDQFITINPQLSGAHCAAHYANQIKKNVAISDYNQLPCFDILFLGMGPDGHTCSLFPNHHLLKENSLWVSHISDSPKPPSQRITLTYPVLNNAKNVVFIINGDSKAKAVKDVLTTRSQLPAALIRPTNGKLYWIIDKNASSLLPQNMLSKQIV